jgi:FlaA1/EpsC-like NDP-sugar epimerase
VLVRYSPIIDRMRRRLRSATIPLHRHSLPQLAVDAGLVALAYFLAFWLRLDRLSGQYGTLFDRTIVWVVLGTAALLAVAGVYRRRWRYATQRDIENLLRLLIVDTILLVALIEVLQPYGTLKLPDSTIVLYFLLSLLFLGGARLLARSAHDRRLRGFRARKDARAVLIIGAGDGGRLVLRELLRNGELGLTPVGFVDDDPLKRRLKVDGVRVRGTTRDLPRILDDAEPDEVIIAIPSAPGELRMRVVTTCRERGIPVRTLPTVFELLRGSVELARQVRDVRVEDVLGREPVLMELERVGAYLRDAVVLVTGAGGSIGADRRA